MMLAASVAVGLALTEGETTNYIRGHQNRFRACAFRKEENIQSGEMEATQLLHSSGC